MDTFHELAKDGGADEGQRGGGGSGLDAEAGPSPGSPRGMGWTAAFLQKKTNELHRLCTAKDILQLQPYIRYNG